MQVRRCPAGGLIDRASPVRFSFDGKEYEGFRGDTLASALLANGINLMGRSFKYHRPRGVFTADSSEPNALMEIGSGAHRDPNVKATMEELVDGLEARSQNRWPSLAFDVMAVNGLLSPIFTAGFYYKTFMWPKSFWEKVYEPVIRRAAGLGRLSDEPDPRTYERRHIHCDILVVGAGPAGLAAALLGARSGARVVLADEDFHLGGSLLNLRNYKQTEEGAWADAAIAELNNTPKVTVLPKTAVFGLYDGPVFAALQRPQAASKNPVTFYWKIFPKQTILATGASERGVVFGGNDKPGVMLASAAQTYVNRFATKPGRRSVVFTSTDDGWYSAAALEKAGILVAAVVDPREGLSPALTGTVDAECFQGAVVEKARGGRHLQDAIITAENGKKTTVQCDLLAVSGGWSPNIGLTCHLGAKPSWDSARSAFMPAKLPGGIAYAGALEGSVSTGTALKSGLEAAQKALDLLEMHSAEIKIPTAEKNLNISRSADMPLWRVRSAKEKAFVDLQHDVVATDISQANREGFRSVEHVKRYTTLGMATDQGRTSNLNGLAILADENNMPMSSIGLTTYRPPYVPVAVGAFAGENAGLDFRPKRLPPSHRWAERQGAVFVEAGDWLRAQYFPKTEEKHWRQSVDREVTAVRTKVGFSDVSTLGKIDIFGPDASVLLERVYINAWRKLAVGKARYGLMLRDDGFAMDDGTTARMAEDHYVMTTTTAKAGPVFQHLKFCHECLWSDLNVAFVSSTDQWAQYALAGPKSRDVLQRLTDHDVSNEALPYMGATAASILGVEGRIFRLSFSGELAYEIAVPARYGEEFAEAIMDAGAAEGIEPYGTEALGVLRIEKGHLAGPELNGQTTAQDLGMGRMMSKKKDFIGRKMALRSYLNAPDRASLVGIRASDPSISFEAGVHLFAPDAPVDPAHDLGYVTSAVFSPTVDATIGLGFLSHAEEYSGRLLRAVDPLRGTNVSVEVCSPHFVDPDGERLRA
ncbi:MAG: sarcosine oxidase subunit alpha family protein [Pseudomonadota bacterium]